jgi:two-component system chemotaxis response regulator CheY
MRALIVDDSKTARMMMGFILKDLGFELLEAADGFAAIEVLRQGPPPELLILDWNMPGLSGGQVLEILHGEPALRPAKIMIVTSETELRLVHRAIGLGGDEYLMKPYSPDSVYEKLELLGLSTISEQGRA